MPCPHPGIEHTCYSLSDLQGPLPVPSLPPDLALAPKLSCAMGSCCSEQVHCLKLP